MDLSPDGQTLAFFSFLDGWNTQKLFIVRLQNPAVIIQVATGIPNLSIDDFIRPLFSKTGDKICFSFTKKVYVVDVQTASVIKTVSVNIPIHFLSVATDKGVFSGFNNGVYQVFSVDLTSGAITQLTSGSTHKLLPYLSEEENALFYLDSGLQLNGKQIYPLLWLLGGEYGPNCGRNSSQGFSHYLNNWGRLAWSESKALTSLVSAYEAYDDLFYLRTACIRARSVLQNMDIKIGRQDWNHISAYGWSATRYSIDGKHNERELVHSGHLGLALARFVLSVRRSNIDSELAVCADEVVDSIRHIDDDTGGALFVDGAADPLNISLPGEGYYLYQKGAPVKFDGINLPFNQQNSYAAFLVSLYEITGNSAYLETAVKVANVFRRHLIVDSEGYKWRYWWGKGESGWTAAEGISINTPSYAGYTAYDGGYASGELEMVSRLANYGVFTPADMAAFISGYRNPAKGMNFSKLQAAYLLRDFDSEIGSSLAGIDVFSERWDDMPYYSLIMGDSAASLVLTKLDLQPDATPLTVVDDIGIVYYMRYPAETGIVLKVKNGAYEFHFF